MPSCMRVDCSSFEHLPRSARTTPCAAAPRRFHVAVPLAQRCALYLSNRIPLSIPPQASNRCIASGTV